MTSEEKKARDREYYHRNRENRLAQAKEYRDRNRDQIREYNRKHNAERKDKMREYREANKERFAAYREEHREHLKELAHARYERIKDKVAEETRSIRKKILDHYGNRCSCCGETTPEFLAIDHINNDGAQHRKLVGGGDRLYRWLIANNFPDGFQLLCHNCNVAKGIYGMCPHQRKENK